MTASPLMSQSFYAYVCLPFVELAHETVIQLGPVIFWPASQSSQFIDAKDQEIFQSYLESISHIKAPCIDNRETLVNTAILDLKKATCISIAESIPKELRDSILTDALYLLYFGCTFRNLYYGQEMPSFNAFRKLIPASSEFIHTKKNWENLSIHEIDREETICLHVVDPEIFHALGKGLETVYQPVSHSTQEDLDQQSSELYKRLIRAIRYLVDRFFPRFVNLFSKEVHFSAELFEAEDVIFLASGFEALFNINEKQPAPDFKHKFRSLLYLKYGPAVEIFWKWVDDFYRVKYTITHGETFLNPYFRLNPNFEISHIFLGIKLFVYAVYYTLFQHQLVHSTHVDPYTPPDFKWIHPQEVMLFFWTEENLLQRLSLLIRQIRQDPNKAELYADVHLLSHLCTSLYDLYYFQRLKYKKETVRFIPSPVVRLKNSGNDILAQLNEEQKAHPHGTLFKILPPDFTQVLKQRLSASS
jgi:hypothetical protein